MQNPFRYFNSSPEVIRLAVMMYVRYPLSLRQVEDLLFERGIDTCHGSVRYWCNAVLTMTGHNHDVPEDCRMAYRTGDNGISRLFYLCDTRTSEIR